MSAQPFRFRTFLQPLLQQQSCRGTVEFAAAISRQTLALGGGPAAAVFIHPRHRQVKGQGQSSAVTPAVFGLRRRLLSGVEGQSHHQSSHLALQDQSSEAVEVVIEGSPCQGGQGGDRDAQRITSRQANAPPPHIKGQG
jgi:hypothetical protein